MLYTMPRKVTPKEHFSARINAKLFRRLEMFTRQSERTRSEVVDRALEEYLDRVAPVQHTNPSNTTPKK
jgi:metal-responsive CopG/Arc/MetJ family transcriptional regulator